MTETIKVDDLKTQSKIHEYFTTSKESKEVDISKLIFRRCEEDIIVFSLINYLQNQVQDLLTQRKRDGSFWYNLTSILNGYRQGDLYIAIDAENNVYGYLLGNDRQFYLNLEIYMLEVLLPYRGKGVGRFIVYEWEKSCLIHSQKTSHTWDGYGYVAFLNSSDKFWEKLGFIVHNQGNNNRMYKKLSEPIKSKSTKSKHYVEDIEVDFEGKLSLASKKSLNGEEDEEEEDSEDNEGEEEEDLEKQEYVSYTTYIPKGCYN